MSPPGGGEGWRDPQTLVVDVSEPATCRHTWVERGPDGKTWDCRDCDQPNVGLLDGSGVARDEQPDLERIAQAFLPPRPSRGCCDACNGSGYSGDPATSGMCWDCRGAGCCHPEPLCR